MMEFKSVPGYDPDDYRRSTKFAAGCRRWTPLVLLGLIFLSQVEWMPLWFATVAQSSIFVVSGLTFFGIIFSIFVLKVWNMPKSPNYVNPLIDGNIFELLSITVVCYCLYSVYWPLTFAAYFGVNLSMIGMHFVNLIKQGR